MGILEQSVNITSIRGLTQSGQRDFSRAFDPMRNSFDNVEQQVRDLRTDVTSGLGDLNRSFASLGDSISSMSNLSSRSQTQIIRNNMTSSQQLNSHLGDLTNTLGGGIDDLTSTVQQNGNNLNNSINRLRDANGRFISANAQNAGNASPSSTSAGESGGGGSTTVIPMGGSGVLGKFMGVMGLASLLGNVQSMFTKGADLEKTFMTPYKDFMISLGLTFKQSNEMVGRFAKRNIELAQQWGSSFALDPKGFILSVAEWNDAANKAIDVGFRGEAQIQVVAENLAIARKILPDIDLSQTEFFKDFARTFSRSGDMEGVSKGLKQMEAIIMSSSQTYGVSNATITQGLGRFEKTIKSTSGRSMKDFNAGLAGAVKVIASFEAAGINTEKVFSDMDDLAFADPTQLSEQQIAFAGLWDTQQKFLDWQDRVSNVRTEEDLSKVTTEYMDKIQKIMPKPDEMGRITLSTQDKVILGQIYGINGREALSTYTSMLSGGGGAPPKPGEKKPMSDLDAALKNLGDYDTKITQPLVRSQDAIKNSIDLLNDAMRNKVYTPLDEKLGNMVKSNALANDYLRELVNKTTGATGMGPGEMLGYGAVAVALLALLKGPIGKALTGAGELVTGAGRAVGNGVRGVTNRLGITRAATQGIAGTSVGATEGAATGLAEGASGATRGGILKGLLKKLPLLGVLLGAGMIASDVATAAPEKKTETAVTGTGGLLGSIAGGAGAGALMGTMGFGPVGTVIGGVVGAIAGGIFGESFSKAIYDFMPSFFSDFGANMSKLWGNITKVFEPLTDVFSKTFDSIVTNFKPVWDEMSKIFGELKVIGQDLWKAIEPAVTNIGIGLGALLAINVGVIIGAFNGLLNTIAPLMSALVNVVGVITHVVGMVVDIFQGDWKGAWKNFVGIGESAVGIFMGLGAAIIGFFKGFIDGIVGFFEGLYDMLVGHSIIPDMCNAIIDWFLSLPKKVFQGIKNFVGFIGTSFENIRTGIITTLANTGADILTWVINLPVNLASGFTNLMDSIGKFLEPLPGLALEGLQKFGDSFVNFFLDLPSKIADAVKGLVGALKKVGGMIIDGIVDGLKDAFDKLASFPKNLLDNAFKAWDFVSSGVSNAWDSLAGGKDNVPYDNYPTLLHKGEMVIPAPQSNLIRSLAGQNIVPETNVRGSVDSSNSLVNNIGGNYPFDGNPKITSPYGIREMLGAFMGGDYPFSGSYQVNSPFGMRVHPVTGESKMHTGVDFAMPFGTEVKAVSTGSIVNSADAGSYGNLITLTFGKMQALYAHLSKFLRKDGDVNKGDSLGLVGSTGRSTGPHLHFEIKESGKNIDPMTWIKGGTTQGSSGNAEGETEDEKIQNQIKSMEDKTVGLIKQAQDYYSKKWLRGSLTMMEMNNKILEAIRLGKIPELDTSTTGGISGGGGLTGEASNWLGAVSRKYETSNGGPGFISSGAGDFGGKSYGMYQLASSAGAGNSLMSFIKAMGYTSDFAGLTPTSASFDSKWKELANDPKFAIAQQKYAADTYYIPFANKLMGMGLDVMRSRALQEMAWSTSVQYGGGTNIVSKALSGMNIADMSPDDIVKKIQNYKHNTIGSYFSGSSGDVQSGVSNRTMSELNDLLGYVDSPGITPYRKGGIVSTPTLSLMGEGNSEEYIIPTDPAYRERAKGLLLGASQAVGVSSVAQNGNNISLEVNTDSPEVVSILQTMVSKIEELIGIQKNGGNPRYRPEPVISTNASNIKNFL
jgi:murein DD-endopeptidase MepM/ murein hydrolase activator NlpD